ncbi:MAG TPA: winged helix DNA-binding domain-containing protein [Pilimelia sp.]|nr:winged helix DNA-binding domain-containing protein [Pilimelia sp.]
MGGRHVSVAERRARLGRRHHLAPGARAATAAEAAGDLVGLHGTDPASVVLAALARLRAGDPAAVEREMYGQRALVRMLGMRRTVFVVPLDLAAVVQAACTLAIAARERRAFLRLLSEAGVAADAEAWLADVEAGVLRALAARGEATAVELAAAEPRLRTSILMAAGKPYEARQNVTTRVLFQLSAEGHIVRGRPLGSWTSSQVRWAPISALPGGGLAEWPVGAAQVELVRRWLRAYGPATVADVKWWTGWPAGEVRAALARLAPVEVDLDGTAGLLLPDDVAPEPPVKPWAALLPALDPTAMGWSQRAWYLGEHAAALFDRSGNVGPTVWWAGRIVGGWAQRPDGEVAVRLLEDVGADARGAVADAADRVRAHLGDVRVTPRFRTPLERELSAPG